MIEKKIIEILTRCYYDEFSGCPDEAKEADEAKEVRSSQKSSSNYYERYLH